MQTAPITPTASKPIAFFGATGGVTIAALVLSLNNGKQCRALVRTPSKLVKLLEEKGVTKETMDSHLTVLEGNAKNVEAVKKVFEEEVGLVIFGIGAPIKFQASLKSPVAMDDPTVCTDSLTSILSALSSFPSQTPTILAVSTTGISKDCDVPKTFYHFYKYVLDIPHADKLKMEELLDKQTTYPVVIVRPAFLDDSVGKNPIQVGWEGCPPERRPKRANESGAAVGHLIGRAEVGGWIYEEIIKSGDGGEWKGRKVTLTR